MTQAKKYTEGAEPVPRADEEEGRGLLAAGDDDGDGDGDDLIVHAGGKDAEANHNAGDQQALQIPRTQGRVRFDLTPDMVSAENSERSSFEEPMVLDDYLEDRTDHHHHRTPLLTEMEAPSVTVARAMGDADEYDDEDSDTARELRRPKSGLSSAFMNMANSIIGAGIIGQPYAMRQAGLVSGVVLLLGLTAVVDWTICLIVINSKLSGTSSFQGTVEYCFGRPGLIAISVAQWAFAFGGMVAFAVIVGDTIPHVLVAVWPGLPDVPVLGLMANRRVAIVVFVLGLSFPLTLYRDIAKVGCFRGAWRMFGS